MKTTPFLVLFAALAAFSFTGCASSGTKFDPAEAQKIEKGKTTRAELLARFGPPMSDTLTGDGREVMVWSYARVKLKAATFIPIVGLAAGGADTNTQTFQVVLDPNKVVESFLVTEGKIETRNGG